MKKLTSSDIAFNVIRCGLIAAIAVTLLLHFSAEDKVTTITLSEISSSSSAVSASAPTSHITSTTSGTQSARLIDINTATASQLCTLNGIGEKKAAAIIQYRSEHGDFTSVEQLLNVPGIGEKLLENLRDKITI